MVMQINVKLGGNIVRPIDGDAVMAILDAYEKVLNEVKEECTEKDIEGKEMFKKIAQVQKIQVNYFKDAFLNCQLLQLNRSAILFIMLCPLF